MRQVSSFARGLRLASATFFMVVGCGHPAINQGTGGNGTGSGGSTSGSGGGTGSGGNDSGSGGSASGSGGSASGGSGSGSGGSGGSGSGGSGSGSGGSGTGSGGGTGKTSCGDTTPPADPLMPGYPNDKHTMYNAMAKTLLTNMSVAEKADQMRGTPQPPTSSSTYYVDIFRQPDNTSRNVKGFRFRDGPRGVNLDAPVFSTGLSHGKSTVFPVPAARGAAFDAQLEYEIGQASGDEMVASGQTMLLAPTTNILRHPRWGRSQETYGEDVFLLGRLGTAAVAGIQEYVPACAKHYAANNIENSRATKNATMDERTLREIYARHFEMMIRDGGVACVMASYNPVNGMSATQNKHLLKDLLHDDFGFNGFTMTDWWALSNNNATSGGNATSAANGVNAGLDMELPMSIHYKLLESLVGSSITQTQIDDAATRILEQKIRFNVHTGNGLKAATTTMSGANITNNASHVAIAEKAARESMVLLKNDNNTLPLKKTGKIAVVGTKEDYASVNNGPGINNASDDINNGTIDFATGVRVGDVGSSRVDFDAAQAIGPFAGIKAAATGATVMSGNTVPSGMDAYVVVVGLTPYDEGEEYNGSGDRKTLSLNGKLNSGKQDMLVMQAVATGKPVVVVVEGGGVVDMPWKDMVQAIVMAWYPGMVGGRALGQLLFGDANFSGKLPVTWPNNVNDFPTFDGGGSTTMDYYLGYRYFENKGTKPLYPFGYGLSYSGKFQYANLQVPCSDAKAPNGQNPGSVINVKFDVTNMGTVAGDEVAFLFVKHA
ncbi:MAG TPA: glycoside hydrolase family 3 C-terminal domain-containing protein, partial [Polyangia bacterium]|nr:glycoside hydrolase family 3 C-terminal domain-containing protein [Polyangia bacterium]